jgi:hypothetical protein
MRGTLSAGRFLLFAASRRVPPQENDAGSGVDSVD